MKKILLASATVALLLAGSACSTNYDLYPEEMAKVLMIKDSGTQSAIIYSAQDKVPYTLTVLKGGVSPEQTATATVRALSEAEYNDYAANAGVAYAYLPSNCYTVGEGGGSSATVNFAGGQGYIQIPVTLDVKAIGAYLEANPNLTFQPAIPLVLESADGKVNENDSRIYIVPDYRIPTISFTNSGVMGYDLNSNDDMEFELTLPMDNLWNIGIKVEADPALLDAYNAENGTTFTMLSSDAFTLPATVTMPEGESTTTLTVKLNRSKASLFSMLPLRITAVDVDGIEVDAQAASILILLNSKLNLTVDMLYNNGPGECVTADGGGLSSLIDGDLGNWYHSSWSSRFLEEPFGSYIGYKLNAPIQSVAFDIAGRMNDTRAYPKRVELYALDSNGEWHQFANSTAFGERLSVTPYGELVSVGPFECDFPFTEFRFCVKESANGKLTGQTSVFWFASEIVVYGL